MAIQPCQSHRRQLIVFWAAFLALLGFTASISSAETRPDGKPHTRSAGRHQDHATDLQAVEIFEKGAAAVRNLDWPGDSGFLAGQSRSAGLEAGGLLHGTSLVLEGKQSEGKKVLSEAPGQTPTPRN